MANPLESAARGSYTLPEWARKSGRAVDLRTSPNWAPQDSGDGITSMGSGNGMGYYAPLDRFAGDEGRGENMEGAAWARPGEAMDYLGTSGQQMMEAYGGNNEVARWLQDANGNITAEPAVGSLNDEKFGYAALLAGGLVGGAAAGLYGGAGAGAAGTAGAAGSGIGTLGTIAPGSAALAPMATTGLASTAPAITASIPQVAGAVGAGLGTLGTIAPGSAALEPIASTGLASTAPAVSASVPAIGQAAGATGALSQAVGSAGSAGSQIGDAAKAAGGAMGMDWSDWAKIGATLIGSGIQSNAASKAVDAQAASTDAAIAEQRRQFDLQRSDGAAYRDAGVNALSQFQTLTNTPTTAADVMQDPGYQFGMDQGQQAIDRKVAAMGGRVSGQAIKAAARFGTNYATTGYTAADQRRNDRLNRLAALAGIGQSATNASASAGSAMANNISGLVTGQGNAAGGGILAQGNIWGNTANQLAALYGRGSQQTGNRPPTSPFANYGGDYNSLGYEP